MTRWGGERFLSLLRPLEPRSLIAAPLIARGRIVGALALVSTRHDQSYTDQDLHTVRQLSVPYGLALDNAQLIETSQRAFNEVSTPVLQIRERLLLLPIIGTVDEQRVTQLEDVLLEAVRERRAKVVVLDITGASFGLGEASRFLESIQAATLLGSSVVITGTTSATARSFVSLGLDLSKVETAGDLQDGIEVAGRILGAEAGKNF